MMVLIIMNETWNEAEEFEKRKCFSEALTSRCAFLFIYWINNSVSPSVARLQLATRASRLLKRPLLSAHLVLFSPTVLFGLPSPVPKSATPSIPFICHYYRTKIHYFFLIILFTFCHFVFFQSELLVYRCIPPSPREIYERPYIPPFCPRPKLK